MPGRTVVGAHLLDFASRVLQERGEVPVVTLLLSRALIRSEYEVPTLRSTSNYSGLPRWAKRCAELPERLRAVDGIGLTCRLLESVLPLDRATTA